VNCKLALKEWSVACEALRQGRQIVLPRKGGIAEPEGEFEVRREHFLLMPTQFHIDQSKLSPLGLELWESAKQIIPPQGTAVFSMWAEVVESIYLESEEPLARLAEHQVLSEESLRMRFQYRDPGIHLIFVRAYLIEPVVSMDQSSYMEGCKSWVDLPKGTSISRQCPSISDFQFDQMRLAVKNAIGQ